MSGITQWLAERGLTIQTLELLDPTLHGTKQLKLDQYGVIPGRGRQVTLFEPKGPNNSA